MRLLVSALLLIVVGGAALARRRRHAEPAPRRARPLTVAAPTLGVLRIGAGAAAAWEAADRRALAALFADVRESGGAAPPCDVLLIYGDLDARGRFAATGAGLREVIRDAGAKVVVVASENAADHYMAAGRQTGYGRANLVMTLGRKGEALPRFLAQLFAAMGRGVPMPEAWVRLAPQARGPAHDALPETIFACELGDVVFEFPDRAA